MKLRTTRDADSRRLWRRARLLVAAGLAALVVAVPVAWAIHDFTDVPTSHPFHDAISAMKRAGITTGCNPPTNNQYCPSANVSREAMAAFLQRGLGRASVTLDGGNPISTTSADIATRTITTPGAGFVLVNAHAMAYSGSGCPCGISLQLRNTGTGATSFFYANTLQAAGQYAALSNGYVFTVSAAGTHTFAASMRTFTGTADADVTLTVLWVPFGSTGGSTLGVEKQGAQSQP